MLGFDEMDAVTGSDGMYYVPKLEVSYDRQLMLVSATCCGTEINLTGTTEVDRADYNDFHAFYPDMVLETDEHEFDWCFLKVIPATPISQATSTCAVGSANSLSNTDNDPVQPNSETGHKTESGWVANSVDHDSPSLDIVDQLFSFPSPICSDPENSANLNGSVASRVFALDDKSSPPTRSTSPNPCTPVSVSPPAMDRMVGQRRRQVKGKPTERSLGQNKSKTTYDMDNNEKARSKRISFNKQADAYPLLLDGKRLDKFLSLEYPSHIELDKWAPFAVCRDSGISYPNYYKLFRDVFGGCQVDKRFEQHIAAISRYYVIDMSDVDDYFTDEDLQGHTTNKKPTSLERNFMDFTLSYLFPDGKKLLGILISPIPYFVVRSNHRGSQVGRTGEPLAELAKRPLNMHRLFATAALHQVMRNSASADTRMVNTAKVQSAIAMIWRRVPPKLKALFILLQKESAALHSSIFPDYKYCPHRSNLKRSAEAMDDEE
ncbi:hypothetical protein V1509DRAFT_615464 [Lipomyces kononenkoae]